MWIKHHIRWDQGAGTLTLFRGNHQLAHMWGLRHRSPAYGPCVSGVQTQALGPAHSGIHHHQPRVRVYMINLSWRNGEVPQEWRAATVVPIPKASKDKHPRLEKIHVMLNMSGVVA